MNYYNDNDKFVCAWLRELIKAKLIPNGDVDERSIKDVDPVELAGYTQCHFFAGIAGWSYALKLAGWPEERKVWTGSCPCQPFSVAGKANGVGDERHLWPAFHWLISKCNPPIVFGEQVAGKAGREWLSGIRVDLEALGYAVGAADLCGHLSRQKRQRIYWVASNSVRERVPRLEHPEGIVETRPWGPRSEADLQSLVGSPFMDGTSWPKPLIRSGVDGVPERVGRLRGCGNSIVPGIAAEFIGAYMEIEV